VSQINNLKSANHKSILQATRFYGSVVVKNLPRNWVRPAIKANRPAKQVTPPGQVTVADYNDYIEMLMFTPKTIWHSFPLNSKAFQWFY